MNSTLRMTSAFLPCLGRGIEWGSTVRLSPLLGQSVLELAQPLHSRLLFSPYMGVVSMDCLHWITLSTPRWKCQRLKPRNPPGSGQYGRLWCPGSPVPLAYCPSQQPVDYRGPISESVRALQALGYSSPLFQCVDVRPFFQDWLYILVNTWGRHAQQLHCLSCTSLPH